MDTNIPWYLWIIGGILLAGFEILVPSFMALWFGIGAIITGLVLVWAPHVPLWGQIALFTGLSGTMAALWFRLIQPRISDRALETESRDAIGATGTVAAVRGDGIEVSFQYPVLGREVWLCKSSEAELRPGNRVVVTSVLGEKGDSQIWISRLD